MTDTARTEMAERIKALREKAEHNRRVAASAETEARETNERAAKCDAVADEYQSILDHLSPPLPVNAAIDCTVGGCRCGDPTLNNCECK